MRPIPICLARPIALALGLAAAVASSGPAQSRVWVTAGGPNGGVFAVAPANGSITTLCAGAYRGVHAAPAGRGACVVAVASGGGAGDRLDWIAGDGSVVCRDAVPTCTDLALDQTAGFAAVDAGACVFEIGLGPTRTLCTIATAPPSAIARDGERGGFVAGSWNGTLTAIDRATGAVTTLATGLGRITGIVWLPRTGGYAVSRYHPTHGVLLVDAAGAIRTSLAFPMSTGLSVDACREHVFAVNARGELLEAGGDGTVVQRRTVTPSRPLSGVHVDGGNRIRIAASSTSVAIDVTFDAAPNSPYAIGIALTPRPVIGLGGGRALNVAADPLLRALLAGVLGRWTRGFAGTTDASGHAPATLTLPPMLRAGTRVYLAALTLDPARRATDVAILRR